MTLRDEYGLSVVIKELALHGAGGFEWYKENCLLRRVEVRMRARGTDSLLVYAGMLADDPAEVDQLLHTLSVRVTEFFRNPDSWQCLQAHLLRQRCGQAGQISAWSMGCATGEEAWSLAMLLLDLSRQLGVPPAAKIRVFASDVDSQGLAAAIAGRYAPGAAAAITAVVSEPYGTVEGGHFVVGSAARERVTFCHEDLTAGAVSPDRCDLVCCRNLLIFLGPEGQRRVLQAACGALAENGLLMLGRTESLLAFPDARLVPIDITHRIYRRAS